MCIISFFLCGHEIHVARCWKCLYKTRPCSRRGNNQAQSCHCTWNLDQKRYRRTPRPWQTHNVLMLLCVITQICFSKNESWTLCFLETRLPEWFVHLKVVIMSLRCLGKFNVLSSRDQTACWESSIQGPMKALDTLYHFFTTLHLFHRELKVPDFSWSSPGSLESLESCWVNKEGILPMSWRSSTSSIHVHCLLVSFSLSS